MPCDDVTEKQLFTASFRIKLVFSVIVISSLTLHGLTWADWPLIFLIHSARVLQIAQEFCCGSQNALMIAERLRLSANKRSPTLGHWKCVDSAVMIVVVRIMILNFRSMQIKRLMKNPQGVHGSSNNNNPCAYLGVSKLIVVQCEKTAWAKCLKVVTVNQIIWSYSRYLLNNLCGVNIIAICRPELVRGSCIKSLIVPPLQCITTILRQKVVQVSILRVL